MNKHFRFSGTNFANRVDGRLGVLPFYGDLDAREGTPPGQI